MKQEHDDIITDIVLAHASCQRVEQLCFSPVRIARALSFGLDVKTVFQLAQYIPLPLLCDALNLSQKALQRRVKLNTKLSARQADSLLQVAKFWSTLNGFFNNDQKLLRSWIRAELPALDGETPARMMATNFGRKVIMETLETMKYGEFV